MRLKPLIRAAFVMGIRPAISRVRSSTSQLAKLKLLKAYVKAVQHIRRETFKVGISFGCILLLVWGCLSCFTASVLLLPIPYETKLWVFFGIGLCFIFIGLVGVLYFMSERAWLHAAQVDDLFEKFGYYPGDSLILKSHEDALPDVRPLRSNVRTNSEEWQRNRVFG